MWRALLISLAVTTSAVAQPPSPPEDTHLTIDAPNRAMDAQTPEGQQRIEAFARIARDTRLIDSTREITTEDAALVISTLRQQTRNGWLNDFGTVVNGLHQTQGDSIQTVQNIAVAAITQPDGTRTHYLCADETNCTREPFTRNNLLAVVSDEHPITGMNANRATIITPAVAVIAGYIATFNAPEQLLGGLTVPQAVQIEQSNLNEFEARQAAAQRRQPRVLDAANENQISFVTCLVQEDPAADLDTCAYIGTRSALFEMYRTGQQNYSERSPSHLFGITGLLRAPIRRQ